MVDIMPPPTPGAIDAPCPLCGAPSHGITNDREGVTYANLLCAAGHIWAAHWLATEVA